MRTFAVTIAFALLGCVDAHRPGASDAGADTLDDATAEEVEPDTATPDTAPPDTASPDTGNDDTATTSDATVADTAIDTLTPDTTAPPDTVATDATDDTTDGSTECSDSVDCHPSDNLCAAPVRCVQGQCLTGEPVVCEPATNPCVDNACVPATGHCAPRAREAGHDCSDDDACTQDDHCGGDADAGKCLGTPVLCTAADECHEVGTCNPLSGVCSTPTEPDGATCEDAPARANSGPTAGACHAGTCRRLPVIFIGGYHGCALLHDDSVRCWGRNDFGQLGRGDTVSVGDGFSGVRVKDAPALGLAGVTQMSLGALATCAVAQGEVRCWGHGTDGALGYGDYDDRGTTPATVPASLPPLAFGAGFTPASVVVAQQGGCAVSDDGRIKCWGTRATGQPGVPEVGVPDAPTLAQIPVVAIGTADDPFPADQLVRGDSHVCVRSGTRIRCWGYGPYIALGDFSTYGDAEPIADAPIVNQGWVATALSARNTHTCAIDDAGHVRCWGANDYGQVGTGATSPVSGVTNVLPFAANDLARKVTTGGAFTCALFNDDHVRCWGANAEGELGRGDTSQIANVAQTTVVDLGGPAHDIAAGQSFTCAVMRDGAIRCWGFGIYGELGNESTANVGVAPSDMPPPAIVFE